MPKSEYIFLGKILLGVVVVAFALRLYFNYADNKKALQTAADQHADGAHTDWTNGDKV